MLFGDSDPDRIDFDKKACYVVGLVAMYGTLADWKALLAHYGPARDEMLQEPYLDMCKLNSLSFTSIFLRSNSDATPGNSLT